MRLFIKLPVFVAVLAIFLLPASANPPHSLTVGDGLIDPIGFHQALPRFSWKLPEGVERQTAYQIEANSEEKHWDSGWVESEKSIFVPYDGVPLISRQRIQWRVRFRDENGIESTWSEPAHFEMGLLSAEDWKARWIRPNQERSVEGEPVATLRRSFPIKKDVAKAQLYVTARGLFDVQLNNARVGYDHFANGWTSYHKRLDTLTYDVTQQLHLGENMLRVLLGTGWYAGRLPFGTTKKGPYGEHPELLPQLEIIFEDGSHELLVSDDKWEGTFDGPVLSSSIYDGESYDARKEFADWQPVHTNSELGSAQLIPKPFSPVRETHSLDVKAINEPQPGRYVFDLGQNIVGWARINVPVVKDRTVTLRFAEMLHDDGTLYTKNYRSAKSTDTYTAAKTGTIEWQPHFTFHGFR